MGSWKGGRESGRGGGRESTRGHEEVKEGRKVVRGKRVIRHTQEGQAVMKGGGGGGGGLARNVTGGGVMGDQGESGEP